MKISHSQSASRSFHLYLDETYAQSAQDGRSMTAVGGLVVQRDLNELSYEHAGYQSNQPRVVSLMGEKWAQEIWDQPHSVNRQVIELQGSLPILTRLNSVEKTDEARRLIGEASKQGLRGAHFLLICIPNAGRTNEGCAKHGDANLLRSVIEKLELRESDRLHVHAEPRSGLDCPRRIQDYMHGFLSAFEACQPLGSHVPRLVAGRSGSRDRAKTSRGVDAFGFGIVDHFLRALRPVLYCSRTNWEREFQSVIRQWSFRHDPVIEWLESVPTSLRQDFMDYGSDTPLFA